MQKILAVNPGATSTKIAVFEDEKAVFKKTVEHQGPFSPSSSTCTTSGTTGRS
jgi:butyrate kinase